MPKPPAPEAILQAALDLPGPEARAAYLDESCAGDEALREDVESLLLAHFSAESFMEPPDGSAWQEIRTEQEGDVIGRYRLLKAVGEGGFGTVYLAEQSEPVKRRVALKVIKPGMDSREVIARFEAERQALAMMDHPHIAKVYDAGTTTGGRPYFVMEFVEGVTITSYCSEAGFGVRARLALFTEVCTAVQHAHQKGVVHRDLKPSNILVSATAGKPVVKVIDFGIAKAIEMELTEKTIFTQMGLMIGTPQYVSPEQAEINALKVDTRSDIFSLGVVLYELLTGTTPLDGEQLRKSSFGEIQRLIREETPVRPSVKLAETLVPRGAATGLCPRELRGDLDWIVLKALEKDPARRYESAGAMAEDLARYLERKPVKARPPSMTYAMLSFSRRHRGAVLAASGLLLALVLGTVGTSIGMKRALDAKEELVAQQAALIDTKERLAGLLESNQQMLGEISRMRNSREDLPAEFEALRQQNQNLLDQVQDEVSNQKRYAEEIEKLQQEKEQFQARLTELEDTLSKLNQRPEGKFGGTVRFAVEEGGVGLFESERWVDFGGDDGTVILTSVYRYLDRSGNETGEVSTTVVELLGSWTGAVFESREQELLAPKSKKWVQEEIRLTYFPDRDQVDWFSKYESAGDARRGRGLLRSVAE